MRKSNMPASDSTDVGRLTGEPGALRLQNVPPPICLAHGASGGTGNTFMCDALGMRGSKKAIKAAVEAIIGGRCRYMFRWP